MADPFWSGQTNQYYNWGEYPQVLSGYNEEVVLVEVSDGTPYIFASKETAATYPVLQFRPEGLGRVGYFSFSRTYGTACLVLPRSDGMWMVINRQEGSTSNHCRLRVKYFDDNTDFFTATEVTSPILQSSGSLNYFTQVDDSQSIITPFTSGIYSYDLDDGSVEWAIVTTSNGTKCPAVDQANGVIYYQATGRVLKIDATDGSILASVDGIIPDTANIGSVLLADYEGSDYVATAWYQDSLCGGEAVRVYDSDLVELWAQTDLSMSKKTLLSYADGKLIGVGGDPWGDDVCADWQWVKAWSVTDGTEWWSADLSGYSYNSMQDSVVCNGRVIVSTEQGSSWGADTYGFIMQLDLDSGAIIDTYYFDHDVSSCASNLVAYGRLYVPNVDVSNDNIEVYRLGSSTDGTEWHPGYGNQRNTQSTSSAAMATWTDPVYRDPADARYVDDWDTVVYSGSPNIDSTNDYYVQVINGDYQVRRENAEALPFTAYVWVNIDSYSGDDRAFYIIAYDEADSLIDYPVNWGTYNSAVKPDGDLSLGPRCWKIECATDGWDAYWSTDGNDWVTGRSDSWTQDQIKIAQRHYAHDSGLLTERWYSYWSTNSASTTPSVTPTLTPTPTPTPSITPTLTPSVTSTNTPTPTPTPSPIQTPTPSITPTPTITPSATTTPTPITTPSVTPTPSATPTVTPTTTPTPSVTLTPSVTPTTTPSTTPTPSVTPTSIPTPSITPSLTPSPTPTMTPSAPPTPSVTPTPIYTPTPVDQPSPTPTAVPITPTPIGYLTPTPTPIFTPSPVPTAAPVATPLNYHFSASIQPWRYTASNDGWEYSAQVRKWKYSARLTD